MLGPSQSIGHYCGAFPAGVFGQQISKVIEVFLGHPGHVLYHFWGIPAIMPFENLKYTAWVLQCAVFSNAISFVVVMLLLLARFIVVAGYLIKHGKESILI